MFDTSYLGSPEHIRQIIGLHGTDVDNWHPVIAEKYRAAARELIAKNQVGLAKP